jgi:hypothetical protein
MLLELFVMIVFEKFLGFLLQILNIVIKNTFLLNQLLELQSIIILLTK